MRTFGQDAGVTPLLYTLSLSLSIYIYIYMYIYVYIQVCILWRVGRGREPWERSEAGGVIGNERHLHRSPVSSPTEELRKG